MTITQPRFLVVSAVFLIAVVGLISIDASQAAQPAKKPAVTITQEPLAIRAGDALSVRTLVQKPPAISGVVSWTIETRRHRGYIATSSLSPDGKKIATGGMDGIIRVWDAESGEFIRALVGHGSYVYGLAWSPDGNTLASTGSFDGVAKLWDVATGMTLRTLKGHKGYTHHVAWSRDGKTLVVAGGTSGFVTLWDVAKPDPVKTVETGNAITGVAWGFDGKHVAVSGVTIGVQVWEIRDGKTVHVLAVPGQNGLSVAWSPDGKTLVGGAATKTVTWDAETGTQKRELNIPGAAVAFSPSGETLAVSSGTEVRLSSMNPSPAHRAVAELVAGVSGIDAALWHNGFQNSSKPVPLGNARFLAWSPDGEGLFGTAALVVRFSSIGAQKPAREIVAAADFSVQLTPGRPLITGMHSTAPQLWDVVTGKLVGTLEGHTGGVTAAAWSRDGKILATASSDKSVRLWDVAGKPIRTLSGHEGPVLCVAWADGKTLASGSSDKTVRVWQSGSDTGKALRLHKGSVNAVAWSKDGKSLASGDEEHAVYLWPAEAEKPSQSIGAAAPVRSLAWSGNGKSVAVGLATGNVELFAPVGGKLIQTLERGGSPPTVTSLAWAPDNTTLLTGRGNHTTQVWQTGTNNALFDLPGMAPIAHVGWSQTGKAMIVSETDRSVRIFDLANGQLRSSVVADGKQVAAVSATGHYHVADEATCELVYVVQTPRTQETLTPKEFVAKFGFRNNPTGLTTPNDVR